MFSNWLTRKQEWFLASKYSKRTKAALYKVTKNTRNEVAESREMAVVFFRLLSKKLNLEQRETAPTEEEVKAAIEQLKDVGRISIFASISILPGGGFSLIGLELLARKFGIKNFTFIPSSFRKKKNAEKHLNIK